MIDITRILFGPLVWLASFSGVYGLHGVLCARGLDLGTSDALGVPLFALLMGLAWAAAMALQVVVLLGLYSERLASPSEFVRVVSHITAWTGLVAAIWTLAPVAVTSSCV